MFFKSQMFPVLFAAILSLLFCWSVNYRLFETSDFFIFDWQSKQLAPSLAADPDIIVIAIDDYSLTAMNDIAGRWVWPRSVHAQLLEYLNTSGVSTVVFDLLFSEHDRYNPDADLYFNEVLNNSDNIFFASLQQQMSAIGGELVNQLPAELGVEKTSLSQENARASFIMPMVINKHHWKTGTINFNADSDGIGRSYDVYRDISGWKIKSLAAKVVENLREDLSQDPRTKSILLQWRGDIQQPYQTISYAEVYQAILTNDQQYLTALHNKIIIVGTTASGLFDARATPINQALPGVYMLATAIDNLKNKQYLNITPIHYIWLIGSLSIFAIASCFIYLERYSSQVFLSALALLTMSILLLIISYYLLMSNQALYVGRILLFSGICFLFYCLSYGYSEYQQRQKTLAMFGRFLDPNIVESLFKKGALAPEKLTKKQVVTILFTDIRGFTNLAEKSDAQEVVNLLNQYFNQQVNIIFKQGGTLDKFIGDCIMAFWGAPLESNTHAEDAIKAALLMEQELFAFRQSLPIELQQFEIGIGIHTGEAIVGMIGSSLRVDYTVIGDAVNLASRIEGLTKGSTRILVSEHTMKLAQHAFDFTYQGEFQVKGRDATVNLYQPSFIKSKII